MPGVPSCSGDTREGGNTFQSVEGSAESGFDYNVELQVYCGPAYQCYLESFWFLPDNFDEPEGPGVYYNVNCEPDGVNLVAPGAWVTKYSGRGTCG